VCLWREGRAYATERPSRSVWFFGAESPRHVRSTRSIFISSAERVSHITKLRTSRRPLDVTHLDHGHDANLPFALISCPSEMVTFGENLTNTDRLCYKYVFTSYWRVHSLVDH